MYLLQLKINELPKRYNQSMGAHWTARHAEAKKWRKIIGSHIIASRQQLPKNPLVRAKVTLTRHTSREPDFDGLVQSFKPVMDALKHFKIIWDDKISIVGRPGYVWIKAPPNAGFIEIKVEELHQDFTHSPY